MDTKRRHSSSFSDGWVIASTRFGTPIKPNIDKRIRNYFFELTSAERVSDTFATDETGTESRHAKLIAARFSETQGLRLNPELVKQPKRNRIRPTIPKTLKILAASRAFIAGLVPNFANR